MTHATRDVIYPWSTNIHATICCQTVRSDFKPALKVRKTWGLHVDNSRFFQLHQLEIACEMLILVLEAPCVGAFACFYLDTPAAVNKRVPSGFDCNVWTFKRELIKAINKANTIVTSYLNDARTWRTTRHPFALRFWLRCGTTNMHATTCCQTIDLCLPVKSNRLKIARVRVSPASWVFCSQTVPLAKLAHIFPYFFFIIFSRA
jgi:hypothetical protein